MTSSTRVTSESIRAEVSKLQQLEASLKREEFIKANPNTTKVCRAEGCTSTIMIPYPSMKEKQCGVCRTVVKWNKDEGQGNYYG